MIDKLKKKFIILAMTSLAVLLAVIVTGMNMINYNTVVRDADEKLEVISDNRGMMPDFFDFEFPGGNGQAPFFMSPDEAEETRYFTVLVAGDDQVIMADTNNILAVDQDQAAEYAKKAIASGSEKGFIDDYRYKAVDEGVYKRVTFLDCGRTLGAFRDFLKASVFMSLAGLLAVFAIICYFAGRIVKPVAESYEKQKRFITDAGHEIKTPLAIIKANIDVMKMDIDDAAEALPKKKSEKITSALNESLDDIDAQVDRLAGLTDDLVYLSRMEEAGENGLVMTDVPISDVLKECVDDFAPLAAKEGKSITSDIAPLVTVTGSLKELEKLISILLENAVKYSADSDEIKVALKREGRNAVMEFRNRAAEEVKAEDLEHVFERFYRADKSRSSAKGGHGIGLSMASAIVNAHGGKIHASTTDGSDFIVTASLPAQN